LTALTVILTIAGSSSVGWAQGQSSSKSTTAGLQQRIDFGNSYIMGQSIKSGAVYLLHRKQSEINSMLQYRKEYRQEILEDFTIQNLKVNVPQAGGRDAAAAQ